MRRIAISTLAASLFLLMAPGAGVVAACTCQGVVGRQSWDLANIRFHPPSFGTFMHQQVRWWSIIQMKTN